MVKYLLLCVMIGLGVMAWSSIPVDRGPGITAEKKPVVNELKEAEPFEFKKATLTPSHEISATVRVIKKKRYFLDKMVSFSPYDVLVGWNELSDQRNLDYLHFSLDDRDYSHQPGRLPLEEVTILDQTALWHLIYSSNEVKDAISSLRSGHIITLSGWIVDVNDEEGFSWNSSKIIGFDQKDKPRHEIIWVTSVSKR